MKETLIGILNDAGKPVESCTYPDGSTALVLPHGGRILGLFAPGNDQNFFWTHPALGSVSTARDFFGSDQWHNSGGDRTWLSPEVDFFLPDYPQTDRYWQPRQLDPGDYRVLKEGEELCLISRMTVKLSRSKKEVDLAICKSLAAVPNPLRHEKGREMAGIEYAGYTLRTSLGFASLPEREQAVGLWSLLQLPHGGEMLIPTYIRTQPRIFFGTIASEDLIASDHLIRYRMRTSGEQKIGLRAVAVTGRAGYRYRLDDGRWALVIRNFFVDPSGQYVDVPWDDPSDLGYAVQACNVNSRLGSFSELEYHVPAAAGRSATPLTYQPPSSLKDFLPEVIAVEEDVSQVWAFRGSWEQIADVAGSLLTAEASFLD